MTIDIFNPPQGGPWGPGIPYQIRDINRIEPIPVPGWWEVFAWDLTLVNTPILREVHRFEGSAAPQATGILGNSATEHTYLPSNRTLTLSGAPVELRVRLLGQAGSVLIEEKTQPMVWDDSYAWMLPAATTAGGFQPTDRVTLLNVQAAVSKVLPVAIPGSAQLVMNVIDVLRGPPRSLLRTFGSQLISGRGSLSAQPPGALHSFGGTWSFFTVPSGYGYEDGSVLVQNRRMAQFVVVREGADDNTYVDVLEDSHWEGNYILWQFPNPTEIQYDIAPGVQVLWRWLV